MPSEKATGSSAPTSKRFLYWLVGGVALCNFIVGYAFFYGSARQKFDTVSQAHLQVQNLVLAVSQSIQFSAEKLDVSLQSTVFALEKQLREQHKIKPASISDLLVEQRTLYIDTRPWEITDADGNVIFRENANSIPPKNLASSSYFQYLKQGGKSSTQLTNFTSNEGPSEQVILSAHSYHNPDGSFAGMVLAPLPLAYFQGFLKKLSLPEKSLLSITTTQNVPVALRAEGEIGRHISIGQQQAVSKEYARLQAQGIDNGTYHADSALDGVPRLYAFQRVKQTPLIVKAGLADSYYLKTWNDSILMRIGVFVVLLLVSLILCRTLFQLWYKQGRYAADLETNNAQLRALLKIREVSLFEVDYTTDTWIPSAEQEFIFGIEAKHLHTTADWVRLVHPDDLDLLLTEANRHLAHRITHNSYSIT